MRRKLTAATSLLVFATLAPLAQAQPEMAVRSGINRDLLDSALDTGDTKIVLNTIIETGFLGRVRHSSIVFDTTESMMEAVDKGEIDVCAMTTGPFFRHLDKNVEPALVLQKNGSNTVTYLLLANTQKSKGKTLVDFKGATFSTVESGTMEIRLCWLDSLLADKGLPLHVDFFKEPSFRGKVNEAAIPVYFGKEDLCLISQSNWDVLSLLNPQMKKRLRVVAKSPGLLEGMLMFRKGLDPATRKEATKALENLDRSIAGSQVLRLGKIEKIVPFREEDLLASREVYDRAMRLRAAKSNSQPEEEAANDGGNRLATGAEPGGE